MPTSTSLFEASNTANVFDEHLDNYESPDHQDDTANDDASQHTVDVGEEQAELEEAAIEHEINSAIEVDDVGEYVEHEDDEKPLSEAAIQLDGETPAVIEEAAIEGKQAIAKHFFTISPFTSRI